MRKIPTETVVGIFVVIGLLSVGYMTLKLGKLDLIGGKYYNLKAHFSSITGLKVISVCSPGSVTTEACTIDMSERRI